MRETTIPHPAPRKRVYLNEFNVLMEGSTYLPFVSGILRAYAEQSAVVRAHYEFAPFLFHTDGRDRILAQYEEPAVAAFSVLMWNARLSLEVAREIKRRYPDCLIVMGGAHVPHDGRGFLKEHPFVDVTVGGDGEEAFCEVLEAHALGNSLQEIAGISWRAADGGILKNCGDRPFRKDLDIYPSPYLTGMYEELIEAHPEISFQAIIETNRGCPFRCTFCYWGKGGLNRKYRFHSMERVEAELRWIASKGIRYVFNADSNFGVHRRDREIAGMLVGIKEETGFPEKFRTCYGKNTDEKIFEIGSLFHRHGLEKGITISYQSVDEAVQKNIQRDNIKMERAKRLQKKFNESGVPIYTELILGLPGETYSSWLAGVEAILQSGLKNQIFMYLCQVYPNTDLNEPTYRERFGIRTIEIELTEIHGKVREGDWVTEREEIVIETADMSNEDWSRAYLFSLVTMGMHSLGLGYFVMAYLNERFGTGYMSYLSWIAERRFDEGSYPFIGTCLDLLQDKIEEILQGKGRGSLLPEFGGLYWDVEEVFFLQVSKDFDLFYGELEALTQDFLLEMGVPYDPEELQEVFSFQSFRIPRAGEKGVLPRPGEGGGEKGERKTQLRLKRNLLEYFDSMHAQNPIPLRLEPQLLEFTQPDYAGDLPRFAKESILWGRKSGTLLTRARRVSTREMARLS